MCPYCWFHTLGDRNVDNVNSGERYVVGTVSQKFWSDVFSMFNIKS